MRLPFGLGTSSLITAQFAETTLWISALSVKQTRLLPRRKNAPSHGVSATMRSISIVYRVGSRVDKCALLTTANGSGKSMDDKLGNVYSKCPLRHASYIQQQQQQQQPSTIYSPCMHFFSSFFRLVLKWTTIRGGIGGIIKAFSDCCALCLSLLVFCSHSLSSCEKEAGRGVFMSGDSCWWAQDLGYRLRTEACDIPGQDSTQIERCRQIDQIYPDLH